LVSGCVDDIPSDETQTPPFIVVSFNTGTDEVMPDVIFTSYEDLELPTRYKDGYVFYGWYLPGDTPFTAETIVDSDITLSIKWVAFDDALQGEDFGDDYFGVNGFLADYYYNSGQLDNAQPANPKAPYQPFEDFLIEIGGDQNFTEDRFIEFMARDLKANNQITYRNIVTGEVILKEDLDDSNRVRFYTTNKLWVSNEGLYYMERIVGDGNGGSRTEYVETTVLTHEFNEDNVLLSKDGLLSFEKQEIIHKYQDQYYLRISLNGARRYLNLSTLEVVNIVQITQIVATEGPIYKIGEHIYSYFEPGIYFAGQPLQYKSTSFTEDFRQNIQNTYSQTQYSYDTRDYTRLMVRILYQIDPSKFTNLFYHPNYTLEFSALNDALIGNSKSKDPFSTNYELSSYISWRNSHQFKE
jgi:hypothetical protein